MAGPGPFQDVHNQAEEIRNLQSKGFWYSTVHRDTYHFFEPNQWIYHRDQNPYEGPPPTDGYARWYPTSRYSYQWIDFPNPDYPTMTNEEGRAITHPSGVPDQWEQNPADLGNAASKQGKGATWAQIAAGDVKGKDKAKGPGKGTPALHPDPSANAGALSGGKGGKGKKAAQADNTMKGAGKGKPAPAPNTAVSTAGAVVLTPAIPAGGAAGTAGAIPPADDGGESRRKRAGTPRSLPIRSLGSPPWRFLLRDGPGRWGGGSAGAAHGSDPPGGGTSP